MVKPAVCPMKPKTSCPKRVSHKKKTRTGLHEVFKLRQHLSPDSIRNSNYRLTGEELHELRRLAQILPTTMRTSNPQNDPLQLLHSARQYINQLNATLMARVQNGTISQGI